MMNKLMDFLLALIDGQAPPAFIVRMRALNAENKRLKAEAQSDKRLRKEFEEMLATQKKNADKVRESYGRRRG